MDMNISVSGDIYDNDNELKTFAHATDLLIAICEAIECIRGRLKEDVHPADREFLKDLLEILHVDGIDDI